MKKSSWLFVFLMVLIQQAIGSDTIQWIRYPAISPDGTSIVFSYGGDLYRVNSDGGTAVLLTSDPAYDFMPVWSNDSRWIAFASDRFGNFDIFLIPASGGEAKRLTFHSSNEYPSAFTPDNKEVLFSASILDDPDNLQYPTGLLSELYAVTTDRNSVRQVLTTPAPGAVPDKSFRKLFYYDIKGYENQWRKHHTSSVTRDIWQYETETGRHTRLTFFEGEDRNPVWSEDEQMLYYLSEQSGTFNVWKLNPAGGDPVQITNHTIHPVRFLSRAENGTLCYAYDGAIYTLKPGNEPQKLNITIFRDETADEATFESLTTGATEMAVSPNGKEIAFVLRGDVFVTLIDYPTTRQITNTPQQERSISFSPDGKAILYSSERNGSWNIYQTKLVREDEPYFALATLLEEEPVLVSDETTFQAHYSPDGKEIAYLLNRETLMVLNLETGKSRKILDAKYNYSYSDGDQWYEWSPDGKWFLVEFSPHSVFLNDVGLVPASGDSEPVNLTKSGYSDSRPRWMMNGNTVIWFSDRAGLRSHGSWGAQRDVYAMFLNRKTWDEFNLSRDEYELLKKKNKPDKEKAETEDDDKEEIINRLAEPVKIDMEGLEDRMKRLTINSSDLADALLTPDGEKLYYLSRFEDGYDLWVHDLRKNETKMVMNLKGSAGSLQMDKKGKHLFLFSDKKILKITPGEKAKKEVVAYKAEFYFNRQQERTSMFDHIWRQVKEKFYDPNLHGTDWEGLGNHYRRFLPSINNNYDFAEMLSEMLGELNASHTGARYRPRDNKGDQTAALGVFPDLNRQGEGVLIKEVMEGSPLVQEGSKITPGTIIEKINGVVLQGLADYWKLLNHQSGKKILLSLYNPGTTERWEEVVKPITRGEQNKLLYNRWIRKMRHLTDSLSGGRIGYVHVKGMNSSSYRVAYSEILGRNWDKEALIVDTRFNGGGWLHDDLATLLNGKKYVLFYPHGRYFGYEPMNKWVKPSAVLMGEGNYSDAHGFPYTYHTLGIGPLVGMPVPGTMTAVWWETLQDPTLVFGIPQVGTRDLNGNYLENRQLEPDYKIAQDYEVITKGFDQQIAKAVEVLLKSLPENSNEK